MTPPVCRFETPPCVHSFNTSRVCGHHAHMCFNIRAWCAGIQRDVLNLHTEGFSACLTTHTTQDTPQHHNTTTTPHTQHSTHFKETHMGNTAQHNTLHTEPTPDPIRENSPGLDTARIDRWTALSSFSVWWCVAVLGWCSDFLFYSICARDLSLLNSVKYDSSLVSSWRTLCVKKYPFSASRQVNIF